jgi:hypothetical protein
MPDEVGPLEQFAQLRPQLLVGRAHHEVAVARLHGLIGRAHLVARAEWRRRHARAPEVGHVPDRERHRRVEQRCVDVLSLARRLRADIGRQHAIDGKERAADIGDGHARLHGLAALVARHAHHAGHRLRHQIEAGTRRPRPALTEAGDARIHDLRIDRANRLVVDPQTLHDAGPVIFDDDVGRFRQLVEELAAFVALQV